jgi:putative transcriptional regulator
MGADWARLVLAARTLTLGCSWSRAGCRRIIMDTLQGNLLVSSPDLVDPNFAKTVVLVAVHGEEGALGLILNREMNTLLSEVWEKVSQSECLRADNVRHGGPVSGSLMAVHDQRPLANLVVTDEIYVATELNAMEALASSDDGRAFFFIGHSGWGPGQLETEMADGSWLVLPATAGHVFGDRDLSVLWKECVIEVGRRQVQSVVPTKHVPDNPRLN